MTRLISLQVVVLDWLHVGRAEAAPAELRIGESLSSRQWSVVQGLEHLALMVTLLNSLMRQRWGVWLAKLKASKSLAALSRAVASVHASEGRYFCPWRQADGFPEECVQAWRCRTVEGEADVKENVNAKPLVADR